MEMWTQNEAGPWIRWQHVALGLDALSTSEPAASLVVVVGDDPAEDPALFAVLHLLRRLATGQPGVIAGTEHPCASWFASVRQAGADRALLVSKHSEVRWRQTPPVEDAHELGPGICPALHVRCSAGTTLSVCGRQADRVVLSSRHFLRWCLATKEQCPSWQGEARA